MNSTLAQRFHVGAIGALIIVAGLRLFPQVGLQYPEGYLGFRIYGLFYGIAVITLLSVRLRQIITQAVVVSPRPGIESSAVTAGHVFIGLGLVGIVFGQFTGLFGGGLHNRLLQSAATAGLWIGLGCIELVIANGRSAVLPPDERPSASVRVLVGMFILIAGMVLGAFALFGLFLFGMRH